MATGQHERQALKQIGSADDMSVSDVIEQLDLNGVPVKDTMKLHPNNSGLRVAVMKDAWTEAGRSIEDPGAVDQYWFEGKGMVLLDFNNE